ncbi:5'-methylthioadenosine/S-adenosylhomocysteine nucleosidase family protein [Aspergillus affinis]|uniref:5'-methylthioadenosine/S-adenosylhomocysteine nucleosidase family protein n=1 Tax=Aspergillus affinis TaxID=1070780 RepID=UPI0022FE8303|nr:ankyrin repeat protein [Aspergillus affinis]KAI9037716.1 ankyrin repeat protein [Aspergillus affinis]
MAITWPDWHSSSLAGVVLLLIAIFYLSRFYVRCHSDPPTVSVEKSTAGEKILYRSEIPLTPAKVEPEVLSATIDASSDTEDSPKKSLTCDEYTVGFITILNFELAAVKAILDEEHYEPSDFEQQQSDDNVYTWGRIGKHNVVLAAFASGSYGTAPAATTAKSMVMSIPSIRIGLLVGIGGGIPCPNNTRDVRLGDVAVSNPRGSSGGIVQYDLGKQKLDTFERVGFVAKPPTVLLNAVTNMEAERMGGKTKMKKILASLQRKMDRSIGFAHQGRENDWLFSASFEHQGGEDCAECRTSCGSHLVTQNTRSSVDPKVHYGIIASGNTVMKDAKRRDELAHALKDETGDCICYEMEAAGLMNDFPCLVIRGISDYADSHKNDRWQKYAAMSAASYAKELLGIVPARQLTKTKKAIEAIQSLGSSLDAMHHKIDDIKTDESHKRIKNWLSPPDPSVNYSKASTIIVELTKALTPSRLLYFYFDFNDNSKQTLNGMIRSLLSQFYDEQIEARGPLDSLFSSCENGRQQPTMERLCVTFLQMLQAVDEIWIVQDALDECKTWKGFQFEGLLSWIKDLVASKPSNIHLLVTSRQEEDVESALMSWAPAKSKFPIQKGDVTNDIRAYVRAQIHIDDRLKRWRSRPDVQEEI